jgi:peptide/nickel transport system permease protein
MATESELAASQWKMMWRRFRKNKAAMISVVILIAFYLLAIYCEFISPYDPNKVDSLYKYAPPQGVHFFDESGTFHLRPFVYGIKLSRGKFESDFGARYPLHFFVKGDPYKIWGLFEMDWHLFGLRDEEAFWFPLGTDRIGRDMFSRIVYGTRTSMSIGLVGIFLSLILGSLLGSKWRYYSFTFGIPALILGETWLTLIGTGLRPPAISWGVLLQFVWGHLGDAATAPWLLLPGVGIFLVVMAFILVGSSLRD